MTPLLSELIGPDHVLLPLEAESKEEVLDELIRFLIRLIGREDLEEAVRKGVWAREREISTGIGRGVAIPHAELDADIEPAAVLAVSPAGVPFDALDSEPVHILFLLICSGRQPEFRLGVLSRLSGLLGDRSIRQRLRESATAEAVVDVIRDYEGKEA
ncbi:MAG: PTS sugar transporter subunit IIA [Candidatus Eisenbacteria bacterium]|nr:PTS sugar transporter subunit IIA [Candidatus Eisenbacteria bacterium]